MEPRLHRDARGWVGTYLEEVRSRTPIIVLPIMTRSTIIPILSPILAIVFNITNSSIMIEAASSRMVMHSTLRKHVTLADVVFACAAVLLLFTGFFRGLYGGLGSFKGWDTWSVDYSSHRPSKRCGVP